MVEFKCPRIAIVSKYYQEGFNWVRDNLFVDEQIMNHVINNVMYQNTWIDAANKYDPLDQFLVRVFVNENQLRGMIIHGVISLVDDYDLELMAKTRIRSFEYREEDIYRSWSEEHSTVSSESDETTG